MGTIARSATVDVVVDAPPTAVWEVVGDPTRTGEWSHECTSVAFVDGATTARPGARFRGRNRVGRAGWTRTCEIVAIDEGRSITWRTIPTRLYPDSTTWSITVQPADDGATRIVEHYEVTKLSPLMDRLIWRFMPVHRDRRQALADDLQRIGEVAAPPAE
jgi:uncharacterized protein YndB with AHSA1/START domain